MFRGGGGGGGGGGELNLASGERETASSQWQCLDHIAIRAGTWHISERSVLMIDILPVPYFTKYYETYNISAAVRACKTNQL